MVQVTRYIPENTRVYYRKSESTKRCNSAEISSGPSPGASARPARPRLDPSSVPKPGGPPDPPVTTACHRSGHCSGHRSRERLGQIGLDLSIALDLRRLQPEPVVEAVLTLARHVGRGERMLVEAVLRDGHTLHAMAEMSGERPRALRRRYRRVVQRLIQHRFAFVAAHARTWPDRRRLVGTLHILRGRTIRETARCLGLTEHATRRELSVIDGLLEEYEADSVTLLSSLTDTPRPFTPES